MLLFTLRRLLCFFLKWNMTMCARREPKWNCTLLTFNKMRYRRRCRPLAQRKSRPAPTIQHVRWMAGSSLLAAHGLSPQIRIVIIMRKRRDVRHHTDVNHRFRWKMLQNHCCIYLDFSAPVVDAKDACIQDVCAAIIIIFKLESSRDVCFHITFDSVADDWIPISLSG